LVLRYAVELRDVILLGGVLRMGWGTQWLPPDMMTTAEVMEATHFSRRTVQNLWRSGLLGRVKFGGRVLVPRADVARVVERIGIFYGKRSLDPAVGRRRLRGPVSGRNSVVPSLIEEMHRTDLVEALQRLPLRTAESSCVIQLDKGVRDFLVTTLRGR
jgi:excisionase family DNA binding protein